MTFQKSKVKNYFFLDLLKSEDILKEYAAYSLNKKSKSKEHYDKNKNINNDNNLKETLVNENDEGIKALKDKIIEMENEKNVLN